MTCHVDQLISLLFTFLLTNSIVADPTYFVPGVETVLQTGFTKQYLKDFKSVVSTVNNTLTLKTAGDAGIYSPLVSSPSHSHILAEGTRQYQAASLCRYELSEVLREVPPTEYPLGYTVVVPCSVVGDPKPDVWWQVLVDGEFQNLTVTERVFLSPNNHLIMKSATVSDSGTYRCVGWNLCGNRCPDNDTCQTNTTTVGDQITISVSRDITSLPNEVYVLNNKQDQFLEYKTDNLACFMADENTSCVYFRQFTKKDRVGNIDVVFVGDPNYSSIEREYYNWDFGTNEFGICMFECLNNSSSGDLNDDVSPLDCANIESDTSSLTTTCQRKDMETSKYIAIVENIIEFIPDIKLSRLEETTVLTKNNSQIQFFTSREDTKHDDMEHVVCYQNNKEIVRDFRTSVTKISDDRNYGILLSINKDCVMRADIGDYFCKVTDTAGHFSLSPHSSVYEIEADCEEVTLNSVTTTSLLVSWLPIQESGTVQESLVVSPAPCRAGDISCGEEVHTQNLTSDQTIANITDLTPGCCYDVTVFLNTGFAMTENRDVSEFKTAAVIPESQTTESMEYSASYYLNDKLRIWWEIPRRESWGSDTLTYQIKRGSTNMEVVDQDYLVVDEEVLPEGQTLVFGEMRLCNSVGCSLPHEVVVNVPFRPNKPTVEILESGCRELKLNISNEDTITYKKYRYGVIKYSDRNDTLPELLFTGNLSMGVNTIKYLKEAKRYSLKIWGINAQDSNTPLLSLEFETHSFCAKEITIVTILVLIVIIVGIMVLVVVRRRIKKKESSMYTYTLNPTGDHVFSDALEDDNISIIHINHDQTATVKPSRNVLLRLKLSLGLKRLK